MFSCSLPPALLAEWPGSFTAVIRGGTDIKIRVSTENRPWRRKFSRRSCRDSNPQPFNHESGALTTELSPPRCRVGGLVEVVSKVELGNDEHHLSLGLGQLVQHVQDPSLTLVITNVDFLQNQSIISGQVGHGWLRHVVGVTCQRHFLALGPVHVDGKEEVVPGLAPPPGVPLLYLLLPQCRARVGGKSALPLILTRGCGMSNLKPWRKQIDSFFLLCELVTLLSA